MDSVENLLRREWADLGCFIQRVANFKCAHCFDESPNEFVVNFVRHKKSFCCDAGLSAIDYASLDCSRECAFEISAWHDDQRVTAAELKHSFFDFARGGARDSASRALASGKRDRFYAWIDNYFFHLLRFDEQRLKNPFVKTG